MADIPTSVISNLISMDGYEQMLEIDRITVEYGVSEEELILSLQFAGKSQISLNKTCSLIRRVLFRRWVKLINKLSEAPRFALFLPSPCSPSKGK